MKNRSILQLLSLNTILPVAAALCILFTINYYNDLSTLRNFINEEKELITDEIRSLLEAREEALLNIEEGMNIQMSKISSELVKTLENVQSIEKTDLKALQTSLGMDSITQEIYIFNRDGYVINTTYKKDLGFRFYNPNHNDRYTQFFFKVIDGNEFVTERFATETQTKKIRKFSYQPLKDHSYILELGFVTDKLIKLNAFYDSKLNSLSQKTSYFNDITLFAASEAAPSQKSGATLDKSHLKTFIRSFKENKNQAIQETKDGIKYSYEYMPVQMKNTHIYAGYVIRIIADDKKETALFYSALKRSVLLGGGILLLLTVLIFTRARSITRPIKQLTQKTSHISAGNLSERVTMEGNKEVVELSQSFNTMVEKLQDSYETLEQKVIDRTAEVVHQKELIEEKQKEILDSIRYSKRIQQALLPSSKYIAKVLEKLKNK